MDSSRRVWQPKVNGEYNQTLSVPFNGLVMTPQAYRSAMESRFADLVEADPRQAKQILSGSSEQNPDLYRIAMSTRPQDWPAQIMTCDQMQMLLNRIDFQKGRIASLPPEEMPSLAELAEAI